MTPEELADVIMNEICARADVQELSDEDYIEFMDELSSFADVNATAKRDELGID